jgi:hypothetical protein
MSVAVYAGLKPVNAKVLSNILLIKFKPHIYTYHGEVCNENCKDQKPYGKAFEHIVIYPD